MSSGGYDAFPPSGSFGYGDSWRPSGSNPSFYERPPHLPARRRSPSPSRRMKLYNRFYPIENSYRPNNYRPDEGNAYYSRSPSPDRYGARVSEPDAWDRTIPWNPPAKMPTWQETQITPISPAATIAKPRVDNILATRMFEPSAAWRHNQVERPSRLDMSRDSLFDRHADYRTYDSPYSSGWGERSPPPHMNGNRYRPPQHHGNGRTEYDSYRPTWSPRSPTDTRRREAHRSSSGYGYRDRRPSGSISMAGSISPRSRPRSPIHRPPRTRLSRSPNQRSSSFGRRSASRSLSRDRRSLSRHRSLSSTRRSSSRGRRSVNTGHRSWSRGRRSRSRVKSPVNSGPPVLPQGPSLKSSWDRPAASLYTVASQDNLVTNNTDSPVKSSWTRPASRSSIASTRASSRAPSPIPQPIQPKTVTAPQSETPSDAKTGPTSKTDVDATLPNHSNAEILQHDDVSSGGLAKPVETAKALPSASSDDLKATVTPDSPAHTNPPALPASLPLPTNSPTVPPERCASLPISPTNLPTAQEGGGIVKDGSLHNQISRGPNHLTLSIPRPPDDPSPKPQVLEATDKLPSPPIPGKILEEVSPTNKDTPDARSNEVVAASLPTSLSTPKSPEPKPVVLREDIPKDAKSFREALRIIVMTRLLCDSQTREERVSPILKQNDVVVTSDPEHRSPGNIGEVIKEATEGPRSQARIVSFALMKDSLVERFKERQTFLTEKTQRLREEYVSLHERWLAHCASLDNQSRPLLSTEVETVLSGRTTRRSMANLGDAVRSDLEMEQIIASLGNDEATDPNHLSLRNLATVPDMISVTHGKVDYRFDDTNHLVEDPREYYGPRTGIHDWTDAEKETFLDQFAAHPKQFGMIAEHIPNKTAAQCVDYYYLHKKKFIDFRKVVSQYAPNKRRRRGMGKKKGNGLLADIRQHDAEVYRDAGSPSSTGRPTRGRRAMAPPEPKKTTISRRRWVPQLEGNVSVGSETPTPEPETRPRRRRVAATPVSRTVSVSLDDGEEDATDAERPTKRAKRIRRVKSAATVTDEPTTPETRFVDQTESIIRRKAQSTTVWSEEDKKLFLVLLAQHGDDFKRIAASMPNKTTIQVNTFYKSNAAEMDLTKVAASAPKRSPTPETHELEKELPYSSASISSLITGTMSEHSPPMSSLNPERQQINHEIRHAEAPRHYEMENGAYRAPPSSMLMAPGPYQDPTGPNSMPNHYGNYGSLGYPSQSGRPVTGTYMSNQVSPSSYPPPQAVSYTYPPYSEPHYPQYDPRITHHSFSRPPHPAMSDPLTGSHRLATAVPSIRSRENPYPILPPPASYHYSS